MIRDARADDDQNATAVTAMVKAMCPDPAHDANAVPWTSLEVG